MSVTLASARCPANSRLFACRIQSIVPDKPLSNIHGIVGIVNGICGGPQRQASTRIVRKREKIRREVEKHWVSASHRFWLAECLDHDSCTCFGIGCGVMVVERDTEVPANSGKVGRIQPP